MPTWYDYEIEAQQIDEIKAEEEARLKLAVILEGYANSLRNNWIPFKGVLGNLLIVLTSEGYLKLQEEHYVKEINHE